MHALKKIPFFLFLLAVFFCLHGYLENYGFINARELFFVGGEVLVGIAIFFGILYLFTRPNYRLAALICFFAGLWYLFFGAIYDWISSLPPMRFLLRFSYLIVLLVILTAAWTIWLRKRKPLQEKMFFYLNVLLIIYCVYDGILLIAKSASPAKQHAAGVPFNPGLARNKPNVYYLLFDEYPGYKSLKDSFAFANDSLYDYLHKKEFRVLPVYSNYHFTLFSMSSILNMKYVDTGYVPMDITQHDFQQRINEIKEAEVVNVFKSMGYSFRNYSIFDVADQHSVADQNSFLPVHSVLITDKILHNRLIRSTGWLLKKFPLWKRKYLFQHEANNKYSEKMLLKTAEEKKNSPVFCYAHFMMPHAPFYRDSLGNYIPDELLEDELTRAGFLSYVKYTNTQIRSMLDKMIAADPGAIFVIMSDHGYRTYANQDSYEPFNYNNICAVRFPGKNYLDLREKWSSVNFFRFLFNCEFNQQLPYLADSSIALSYRN